MARNGLAARAYEAGRTADIVDQMPAVVGQYHLTQNVAGEHLALNGLFAGVGELGDGLHGDIDLVDQILHSAIFGSLHDSRRNCVFIT